MLQWQVDTWSLDDEEGDDVGPIGDQYRVVLRSYERL